MGFFDKEETGNKTYTVEVYCLNCAEEQEVDIPFGTTVKDYISTHEPKVCKECGCSIGYKLSYDV